MAAQQTVGLGIGNDFTSPSVSPAQRARLLAVIGNLPTFVGDPCGLELLFGLADGRDLGWV